MSVTVVERTPIEGRASYTSKYKCVWIKLNSILFLAVHGTMEEQDRYHGNPDDGVDDQ